MNFFPFVSAFTKFRVTASPMVRIVLTSGSSSFLRVAKRDGVGEPVLVILLSRQKLARSGPATTVVGIK